MDEDEDFDETTDGPDVLAARRALAESQASTTDTLMVIEESRIVLSRLVARGDRNHFAETFRRIIQEAR